MRVSSSEYWASKRVMKHEALHSIGIGHTGSFESVMAYFITGLYATDITLNDIALLWLSRELNALVRDIALPIGYAHIPARDGERAAILGLEPLPDDCWFWCPPEPSEGPVRVGPDGVVREILN